MTIDPVSTPRTTMVVQVSYEDIVRAEQLAMAATAGEVIDRSDRHLGAGEADGGELGGDLRPTPV